MLVVVVVVLLPPAAGGMEAAAVAKTSVLHNGHQWWLAPSSHSSMHFIRQRRHARGYEHPDPVFRSQQHDTKRTREGRQETVVYMGFAKLQHYSEPS